MRGCAFGTWSQAPERHIFRVGAESGGIAVNVTSWTRRAGTLGLALAFSALVAAPAAATPDTLKRSIENLSQWPLDLVLSPIVAGQTVYTNLNDIEDSPGVRLVYPVPGYFWTMFVQAGASVLRGMTGLIEFPVGLAILFTDAEFDPIFDPADEQDALVDFETDFYWVKFGINYTTASY